MFKYIAAAVIAVGLLAGASWATNPGGGHPGGYGGETSQFFGGAWSAKSVCATNLWDDFCCEQKCPTPRCHKGCGTAGCAPVCAPAANCCDGCIGHRLLGGHRPLAGLFSKCCDPCGGCSAGCESGSANCGGGCADSGSAVTLPQGHPQPAVPANPVPANPAPAPTPAAPKASVPLTPLRTVPVGKTAQPPRSFFVRPAGY